MPAPYQPKKPAGHITYNFSISKDQQHLKDLLTGNKNRSAVVREALECFLIVYDLYGEDWRLRLHELKRPVWLDGMDNRLDELIHSIHNLKVVATEDNSTEEGAEIEIGGEMFYEA